MVFPIIEFWSLCEILSDEENSVELVVGKPVIYSKSVKKEIEIDAIYSLSPSPVSNSFTSMSSLQSLPLEEEVSAPEHWIVIRFIIT